LIWLLNGFVFKSKGIFPFHQENLKVIEKRIDATNSSIAGY
jgi:hypothetical protein